MSSSQASKLLAQVNQLPPHVKTQFAEIIHKYRTTNDREEVIQQVTTLFGSHPPLLATFKILLRVRTRSGGAAGVNQSQLESKEDTQPSDQVAAIPTAANDWTQRTESTLRLASSSTTTTNPPAGGQWGHVHAQEEEVSQSMNLESNDVTQQQGSNEPDPRMTVAASIPFQPGQPEMVPILLRLFFHDYAISQTLGLPYFSIPIIDLISDYLFSPTPTGGSRGFQFSRYWLAEHQVKFRAKNLTGWGSVFNESHFKVSFPYELHAPQTYGSNEERYHDLTAIGERDEAGDGWGELINVGDLHPQRRLWSIFAQKSRDEIRLEDYRTMSEAELDGSLSSPEFEWRDEWNRRRPLVESHWRFVSSMPPFDIRRDTDSSTQLLLTAALDAGYDERHPTAAAPRNPSQTILYMPKISQATELPVAMSTPYTSFSPTSWAYSFQLHVYESENSPPLRRRVCYFGFGLRKDSWKGGASEILEDELSPVHGQVIKVQHDPNEDTWIISTVPHQSTALKILKSVPVGEFSPAIDSSPIFTCQYESVVPDARLVRIRWLINGELIHELVDQPAAFISPKFYVSSWLRLKLKHQLGPNPTPFRLDALPKSFDEASPLYTWDLHLLHTFPTTLALNHQHRLFLKSQVYDGEYECNLCGRNGHDHVYHCSLCLFDSHPKCARKWLRSQQVSTDPLMQLQQALEEEEEEEEEREEEEEEDATG